MLDLPFSPDSQHPDPVYRQLANHLAELIAAGRLLAGERVPRTRELATALLLSFAGLAPDAIRTGVSELAGLVRRPGARPRRNAVHRVARRGR